jgi:peptidyl-prolyl cis-trans isomerase A (cyclophilin A)
LNDFQAMMHQRKTIVALGITFALLSSVASQGTVVRFTTSLGTVNVRLYDKATPNSVANFLYYVNNKRYSGSFIHRVPQRKDTSGNNLGSQHFVVQGGGFLLNGSIFNSSGIATKTPIGDEPGISNIRGTLAFAKNSLGATSQWFFNVGDNSFLNSQGFTVFGRVVGTGMTVIDAIDNLPANDKSNAQNAPGEDFDEIPVRNLQQVISSGTITNNEAVMADVAVLNFQAGDYDFNGVVNQADYNVWRTNFGSTTNAAPDGNGDGVVDARDYVVWRNTLGLTGGPGGGTAVPEPSAAFLTLFGGIGLLARRQQRFAA